MIKPGMIGFSDVKESKFGKLIKFFTDSKISHSFIITDNIFDIPSVQEASEIVQIVPFEKYLKNQKEQWIIFKIKDHLINEYMIRNSLSYCHKEFSGQRYGIFQLPYFIWLWVCKKLNINLIRKRNWITSGIVCSELVYWYLYNLGPIFRDLLKEFNPDIIQAQDILDIINRNDDIFEYVDSRGLSITELK